MKQDFKTFLTVQKMSTKNCNIPKNQTRNATMKNPITIKRTDIKTRITWGFNPVTRVVKSKKRYDRNRIKANLKREIY